MYITYDPQTNNPHVAEEDNLERNIKNKIGFDGVKRTLNFFQWNEKFPDKIASHTVVECDEVGQRLPRSHESKREFTYDDNGKLIAYDFYVDNILSNKTLFKYDDKGRLDQEIAVVANGMQKPICKYFYDEHNNVIACNSEKGVKHSWSIQNGKKVYGKESLADKMKKSFDDFMFNRNYGDIYGYGEVKQNEPLVQPKSKNKISMS